MSPAERARSASVRSAARSAPFVENAGQWRDPAVRFAAPVPGGRLLVTASGDVVYALGRGSFRERLGSPGRPRGSAPSRVRVNHLGALVRGPVPAFAEVSLGEVAPGIQATLRAASGTVEKVFRVQPGADPEALRIAATGARLAVAADGGLEVGGPGRFRFSRPIAYQEGAGGRAPVAVAYRASGESYGFELGRYDRGRELVIDPILQAERLGGGDFDELVDMAATDDAIFVAGSTMSADLPTGADALDRAFAGSSDAFIARLDLDLSLVEITYLGGSSDDTAHRMAIRADGRVVVAGTTSSDDFPIVGGAQALFGGVEDSYIAVLEEDLSAIAASTYLGGSDWPDEVDALSIGSDGAVFAAGTTASPDWPTTPGALDTTREGMQDGFVTRLSPDLSSITASTLLGGGHVDAVRALALAVNGDVIVVGTTWSDDFPVTPEALETMWDGGSAEEGFVTRLDGDLGELVASTYLGGDSDAQVKTVAVATDGRIAVAGDAYTASYPVTAGAYDPEFDGPADAFVTFLEPDLTGVVASTYLGGAGALVLGEGITLADDDSVFLVGRTYSSALPVLDDATDSTSEASEVFAVLFDADLADLLQATYLGGAGDDVAWGPAVLLADGRIAIAGGTDSDDFPALGAGKGGQDGFVVALDVLSGSNPFETPDAPTVALTAGRGDLGLVAIGATASTTVTLGNGGAEALPILSTEVSGAGFAIAPGGRRACGSLTPVVAAGGSCSLELTFTPAEAGEVTAVVTVAGATGVDSVSISATGIAAEEPDTDEPGDESDDDSDGGCRAGAVSRSGGPAVFALLAVAAAWRRRRPRA